MELCIFQISIIILMIILTWKNIFFPFDLITKHKCKVTLDGMADTTQRLFSARRLKKILCQSVGGTTKLIFKQFPKSHTFRLRGLRSERAVWSDVYEQASPYLWFDLTDFAHNLTFECKKCQAKTNF